MIYYVITFLCAMLDLNLYMYINIVKLFFFSGETYKYQETTQKLTKTFKRFLRILLQLGLCRFRLIISEQKFRSKSQGTGVLKELFRTQSGIQTKYGGV